MACPEATEAVQRWRFTGVTAVVRIGLLIASAYLMAQAVASTGSAWVGCVTLLPLFEVIRSRGPSSAFAYGGLWGLSFYAFGVAAGATGLSAGLLSLVLLTAVPAVYACVGSKLTRWIGFSPFVLGVAWMGVELALQPLGLRTGLLAGTQDGGTVLHLVGGALGYVVVAFLVAYVNAVLVSALAAAHQRIPPQEFRIGTYNHGTPFVPQAFSFFPSLYLHPSRPRAPPAALLV